MKENNKSAIGVAPIENEEMSSQKSYELIKAMIQKTKTSGGAHSGDTFLVFGYLSLLLGIFTYIMVSTTGNAYWTLAWWGEVVIGIPLSYWLKRRHPHEAKTYTGEMIGKMWIITNIFAVIIAVIISFSTLNGIFMCPLILIITSMATAATLFILNEKYWMTFFPGCSFSIAMGILIQDATDSISVHQLWLIGLAFFVMMAIPGHILNHKYGKKQ